MSFIINILFLKVLLMSIMNLLKRLNKYIPLKALLISITNLLKYLNTYI